MQEAVKHHQTGELQKAEVIYKKVLESMPTHADALNLLGLIASQKGNHKRAEQLFRRAILNHPNAAGYYNNLGNALKNQDKFDDAIFSYQKVFEHNPDAVAASGAHVNIGNALKELDRYEEAITSYEKALEIMPNNAEAYKNMGSAFKGSGRFDRAIACFRKALVIRPDFAEALHNIALCKKFTTSGDETATRILELLEQPDLPERKTVYLRFALGKIYDDCGLHDEAFGQYQQANAIKHQMSPFDSKAFRDKVDRISKVFTKEFFAKRVAFGNSTEFPVFIIGMPRSGTTLVEQIISSHSKVCGAGELKKAGEFETALAKKGKGYPENVINLKPKAVLKLAAEYEAFITRFVDVKTLRVTDKMPANFLHLGLIALLFPKARVIHCRRNPLDTCLSNYFQYFAQGNEQAYDLKTLGDYYGEYERLMAHWRKVLPLPMYEIVYEDLINAPQEKSRELIEFLGLEWEEECLSFHQSRKTVKTASAWQARQPIYTGSKERWRHYVKYLGPLKESLGID